MSDRVAWLWLKSLTGEAIKIRTATVAIPETGDVAFQEQVNHLRQNPAIGRRVAREAYLAELKHRDTKWFSEDAPVLIDKLSEDYRQNQGT